MLPDNRLDFISNIDDSAIEIMTIIRKKFIELDDNLKEFEEFGCHKDNVQAAMRSISLARTHIETALQYAIKSLCLIGEIKEPKPEQVL